MRTRTQPFRHKHSGFCRWFNSKMARRGIGPWTGPEVDKEFAERNPWVVGDVVEAKVLHDDKIDEGIIVMLIAEDQERSRSFKAFALRRQGP